MILKSVIALLLSVALTGCAFVPASGPNAGRIVKQQEVDGISNYMLVDLDRDVSNILSDHVSQTFAERFSTKHTHTHRRLIRTGDVLDVTIFEAGEGGLFSSGTSRSANFAAVQVSQNGEISLPYTGVINVDGDTPIQIQNKIVARLKGQAIDPQALVTVADNQSNSVIVGGDVRNPGRIALSLRESSLLDTIALAGGPSGPTGETFVTFIRGKTQGRQLLYTIIDEKGENITVNAGDRIVLRHEPEAFVMLGTVNRPGTFPMLSTRTTLLEAIGSASRFSDQRASRRGLFVFRLEPRAVAEKLGTIAPELQGATVPVVYRLQLHDPISYFAATNFIIRNKDTVFVANSGVVDIRKVLGLFSTVLSPAAQTAGVLN